MIYVLLWILPGLLTIGVVTGALRATGALAVVAILVTALVLIAGVAEHASCVPGGDCGSFVQTAQALAASVGALVASHLIARIARRLLGAPWQHLGAGPGPGPAAG